MKKYLSFTFIVMLLVASVFSGCTNQGAGNNGESGGGIDTRTVVDLSGEEIEIPAVVSKVCASYPALEAIFLLLGCPEKNIAVNDSNANNEWYMKMYPELANNVKMFTGTDEVNVETLLANKPDVVFVSTVELKETIAGLDVPVLLTKTSSTEDIINTILMVGEVMGEKEYAVAKELVAYFEDNMAQATVITDSIAREDRPAVFYAAAGILNTEGEISIVTDWIERGGGINIAAEMGIKGMFEDVSVEQFLEWDPEVIICRDYSFKNEYQTDERLATVSAIKNDRIYVNPRGVFPWCVRSADEALQSLWAATVIQPELFEEVDMESIVREFYAKFYNYPVSDEEIKDILFPTYQ